MRFDTPVYFQIITLGDYDPNTGNYGDEKIEEIEIFCDVTDAGTQTETIVYGGLKEGSLVIRLKRPLKKNFNYVRIGEKRYRVDHVQEMLTKQSIVVSEAMG